jgi:hypothetical protein
MKISLEKAFEILQNASAVIIDDDIVLYPSLEDLQDDEAHEFLYLAWETEGLDYHLTFREGDNKEVEVVGSSMFLYDASCKKQRASRRIEHTQITILTTQKLEGLQPSEKT